MKIDNAGIVHDTKAKIILFFFLNELFIIKVLVIKIKRNNEIIDIKLKPPDAEFMSMYERILPLTK